MVHSYPDCTSKKPGDQETIWISEIECITCIDREIVAHPSQFAKLKRDQLIEKQAEHNTANRSGCECGAQKCGTTHATWCPAYKK